MRSTLPIVVLALLGLAACGTGSSHQHEGDAHVAALQLNDGEKWLVNEEMKPHLQIARDIVQGFGEGHQIEDYHALAEELRLHNEELISNCIMTGDSHQALHTWLHPYMATIEKLSKVEHEEDARNLIGSINQAFTTYDTYFE